MTSRLSVKKIAGLLLAGFVLALGLLWLLGQERQSAITVLQPATPSRTIAAFDSPWRSITPENNLTRRAAQGLATELIDKNKGGPAETPEGLMVTLNPAKTLTTMLSSVQQVPHEPFKGVALSELHVLQNDSPAHRRAYFEDFSAVLNRTIGSTARRSITSEELITALAENNAFFDSLINQHNAAVSSLETMPVPASLAPLHKKVIDNLAKTNIMLQGMTALGPDPLRALLAVHVHPALLAETEMLQEEFSSAIRREYLSMTFWEQIFGSAPAHAIIPGVTMALEINPTMLSMLPRDIAELIGVFITHNLKNRLLSELRGNVLELVQGAAGEHCPPGQTYLAPDGRNLCPRFVLNWEQMLFRAQRSADVRLLQEIAEANIPEAYKEALIQMYDHPAEGGYGVTFGTRTQNIQNCEGMESPTTQMLCWANPANSFAVIMGLTEERKEELRSKYEEGREAQATADRGFKGAQKCVREIRNIETGEVACIEYVTTEPGIITQELMAQAKTSEFDQIINADDLQAVIVNLASSFISQLWDNRADPDRMLEGILGLIRPAHADPPMPGAAALEFSVTPDTIIEGESATLEWDAGNASFCFFGDDSNNRRDTSGSEIVTPTTTTTYNLRCFSGFGGITRSVTVTVLPVRITFSADPTEIYQGETVTLNWSTENAVSCTASGAWEWSGTEEDPRTSGSEVVTPTETSTYSLQCYNEAGRHLTESITITVSPPPAQEGGEPPEGEV